MRRFISLCLTLVMLMSIFPAVLVSADESEFEISGNRLVRYHGSSSSVTVPAEVEVIGSGAFMNNRQITSVRFAGKVTSIQANAFAGCSRLARVSFADKSALESIGAYAFAGCLPMDPAWANGVKSVAGNAFDGCNIAANKPTAPTNTPPVTQLPPTPTPVPTPTPEPTAVPTAEPTAVPTPEPTAVPTAEPTAVPTAEPTAVPETPAEDEPTVEPTPAPTAEPTAVPETPAEDDPAVEPTPAPTAEPTAVPETPAEDEPTVEPTPAPTAEPTAVPETPAEDEADDDLVIKDRDEVLAIVTQPTDQRASIGDQVYFTVTAEGEGLTYQWYWRKATVDIWYLNTNTGNRTNTLTIDATSGRMGNHYRCVVTDASGNTVTSDAARLINQDEVLNITTQPADISAVIGSTVQFKVVAEGANLTYQWYWRKNGTDVWYVNTNTGNKTSTLTIEATQGRIGNSYRCVVTDAYGNTLTSDNATLCEKEAAIRIVSQPADCIAHIGETVTFNVNAVGEELAYQWYWRKASSDIWYVNTNTGNQSSTLTIDATSGRMGNHYRCVITDAEGNTLTTAEAGLLNADDMLSIVRQPVDYTAQIGDTVKFTVVAEGSNLTYQWYWCKSGTTVWYVNTNTGNKTSTLTIEATQGRIGNCYRCVVTDAYGNSMTSDEVYLIEAGVVLEIVTQPTDQIVPLGETAVFTVGAAGHELTYQWYWHSAASDAWFVNTLTGNRTNTLTFTATQGRMGNYYRCVVTDNYGNELISDTVRLLEYSPYVIIDDVKYLIEDGEAEIVEYTGSASSLTIPATVNEAPVTRVCSGAFEGNTTLTSIDLPDSIQTIGSRAFADCTNLREIK